jgi:hypothetical protein
MEAVRKRGHLGSLKKTFAKLQRKLHQLRSTILSLEEASKRKKIDTLLEVQRNAAKKDGGTDAMFW